MGKTSSREAKDLISNLKNSGVQLQCPCCEDSHEVGEVDLFHLGDFSPRGEGLYIRYQEELADRQKALRKRRRFIPKDSEERAEATNIGLIFERIAPALGGFGFDRNDCRALFDPIDYVIFQGLSRNGKVDRIVFTDIKTGDAKLKRPQKQVRDVVNKKKVSFDVYDKGKQS